MMVDIERRRYVAFLRGVPERLMSTSEDFVHWSPPRPSYHRSTKKKLFTTTPASTTALTTWAS